MCFIIWLVLGTIKYVIEPVAPDKAIQLIQDQWVWSVALVGVFDMSKFEHWSSSLRHHRLA